MLVFSNGEFMKITILIILLFTVACSTQESRQKLQNAFHMQYSHGFYILTEPEIAKLNEGYSKLDKDKAAKGATIYKKVCQQCHGITGKGNGPRAIWEQPPANLIKRVKGKPFKFYFNEKRWQERMPGWELKLSKNEVEELRHYIMFLTQK